MIQKMLMVTKGEERHVARSSLQKCRSTGTSDAESRNKRNDRVTCVSSLAIENRMCIRTASPKTHCTLTEIHTPSTPPLPR